LRGPSIGKKTRWDLRPRPRRRLSRESKDQVIRSKGCSLKKSRYGRGGKFTSKILPKKYLAIGARGGRDRSSWKTWKQNHTTRRAGKGKG